mmetsp:Transcript_552/g.1293  ORF Transcript_552/g.1293 Transcript_552/m.1293 type:complete len:230 (-) Transcript_552:266-955(-)
MIQPIASCLEQPKALELSSCAGVPALLLTYVPPDEVSGAHLHDAAVLHVRRHVGVLQLLQAVRDPHGGDALAVGVHHPPHGPHHPGLVRLVQKRGQLVQQQHPRVLHQRPRDGHALLLPPAERGHLALQHLLPAQVHRLQRPRHPPVHLRVRQVAAVPQPERHVRAHAGHDHLVVGVLEHERARGLHAQPPAPRSHEPGERPQQGGLAAAVGPQQHEEGAPGDPQRHPR